ncbi:cytidyltransferase [Agrobacterium phage Atu_ph07]|uniref:Cytidyltransferase-like domain-containing protein n=1 Tax=Agrobacterium phage Atu_ph07 TaxID=2024264 RepID=A0A223W063_9CAUD|nr:cytidyltransferase [Agrobacterium phage Atu_ph07]ASV44764.1 hypothetical protein [Agrobacterium phage Atu_ph07]
MDIVIGSGRFNPPTDGHYKLFKMIENTAISDGVRGEVFIVDGIGSSQDVGKNPLSISERQKIIKRWVPSLRVDFVNSAYDLFDVLDVQNKNVTKWFIGKDREKSYKSLLKQMNSMHIELMILERTDEDVSATKARQFAIEGDIEQFCKMMPTINTLEDNLSVINLIRGKNNLCHMTLKHLPLLK